ncbi:methionine synthase [Acidimicrobiia bacterium EGI L10123]|uniref:methionine synthase n=1 Tax=Salinilacustrithrix flava TaxID=2957203 RepID=UPI003D7C15CA|nr:methionine synthase [Acidimicrobiia bacterium EGI L10123]
MPSPFLDLIAERVVVYDGAFGTYVQGLDLTADDFGGEDLEGCNEILAVTRPDVIAGLHESYFAVGCDVTETATFGAFATPLAEYGLADRTHELNVAAARLARDVASDFATDGSPRFVAGSIGPGTKMPTLGHITYAELRDQYEVQARGLLEGGVDLFLIETQYDLLGLKAAVNGCKRAMAAVGTQVPIQAQVTIEMTGTMLPGTEIGAALAAIDPLGVDVIGLNCATGPGEMSEHLRYLSQHSRMPISALPNAGLPSVVDGAMHYDLTPEGLLEAQSRFITDFGVQVVGGCCGTGAEHIRLLAEHCKDLTPAARTPEHLPGATSVYSFTPFEQDLSVLIIGERTNANGSKAFREAMIEGDWDTTVKMAKDQVAGGAHVIDVCVDYVGRDGNADMHEVASRFSTQSTVPLMIDSTEPDVVETALQHLGGRAILNSVNLEDGDAPGTRLDRFLSLAKEYGAAVVCTCIDTEGQARDAEWKLRAARAIHDIAVERYGLEPSDLIFDPLALTLGTGLEESRRDGIETLDGIRLIKEHLPGVHTTLGLSNISFGLKPAARHVLNSVYLHECQVAGLDSAIVHAGRILPLSRIPDEQRDACMDLVYDRRGTEGALSGGDPDYDPLTKVLELFEDVESVEHVKEDRSDWPVEERLKQRIIDGERNGLVEELEEARTAGIAPLDIINDHLLAGMKVVGELFGSGEMQLPFVLQSAETMKAAVAHLEQYMEKSEEDTSKGRIVLATVKGDVHDIGKNLVDIILTNNGYEVHNLGIKVPVSDMIAKAQEIGAHAIGMSGLLVKSTLIMRDNLEELNQRELSDLPVILGGAALTRSYVERDLREVYDGRLFYGRDAFEGLRTMDRLRAVRAGEEADDPDWGTVPSESTVRARAGIAERDPSADADLELPDRSPEVTDVDVPTPPFWGSQVVKGIAIDDIAGYINETALFRNQWQFRPETKADGTKETDAEFKDRIRPQLRSQLAEAKAAGLLQPAVVYGYFPANKDGDDLVIWTDETATEERVRFPFPRQREAPFLCVADFFRPVGASPAETVVDVAAFHVVTMGHAVSERTAELFAADKYQEYMLVHGIGVEMAEALAELWHRRIREELGIADEDGPDLHGLFRQQYRGGRYSWGYPACPDLEDNETVATLLGAERIGIEVSEDTGFQFQPEQSTSALICHHPRAKYFVAR